VGLSANFPSNSSSREESKSEKSTEEMKIKAAASSVSTDAEKKATEAQSMLLRYGTSCFLQLFDEDPSPSDDKKLEMSVLPKQPPTDHGFSWTLLG